jgi:flavin reductase (DIM6/NTAB) family NADH-FMN oxidoreductase RutF
MGKYRYVAVSPMGVDDGAMTKVDVRLDKAMRVGPPTSVVLATCISKDGRPNIITLGMYMHISNEPPLLAIGVSPRRFSHQLIKVTREFVINVPPVGLIDQVVACGETSGRDVDKFELTGLTPVPAREVRAPLIKECISHLECRLAKGYRAGDHTLFVGEVVAASVDEGLMQETLDITKARTILHKGGRYFEPRLFRRA